MSVCRAGRGSEHLPAEAACPRQATRPSIRGGRKLTWCDEHHDTLRRAALAIGFIEHDADELRSTLLTAADKPRPKLDLAAALGMRPHRRAFVAAFDALIASGELVERLDGNAKLYVRPDAAPEPPAPARRPRSEQAAQLARLVAARGRITRDDAADELGIARTSVPHILATGRGHGWLETHGRRDPYIWPGPTTLPEAVAA